MCDCYGGNRIPISELMGAVRIPLIDFGIEVQGQSHGSFLLSKVKNFM